MEFTGFGCESSIIPGSANVLIDSSRGKEKREEIEGENEKTPKLGRMRLTTMPIPLNLVGNGLRRKQLPSLHPRKTQRITFAFIDHDLALLLESTTAVTTTAMRSKEEGCTKVQYLRCIRTCCGCSGGMTRCGERRRRRDGRIRSHHTQFFSSIPLLFGRLGTNYGSNTPTRHQRNPCSRSSNSSGSRTSAIVELGVGYDCPESTGIFNDNLDFQIHKGGRYE
jgi:hypothetical protein